MPVSDTKNQTDDKIALENPTKPTHQVQVECCFDGIVLSTTPTTTHAWQVDNSKRKPRLTMKILLQIFALCPLFTFVTASNAVDSVPTQPPTHCPSSIACAPFQPQYLYSKTLGSCPPRFEDYKYECGPQMPPINVQCLPSAYEVMGCEFDPEGINVPISHQWRIDSNNATIGAGGRVRCNAGELVAISVFVWSSFDSGTGYTYAICPASNY